VTVFTFHFSQFHAFGVTAPAKAAYAATGIFFFLSALNVKAL
jgi:hypothetical protein